jgi:hypothetical protein
MMEKFSEHRTRLGRAVVERLATLRLAVAEAMLGGDGDMDVMKVEAVLLRDVLAKAPDDLTREGLVAVWPATLPKLPLFILDPEKAAELDPVKEGTASCDVSKALEEPKPTEEELAAAAVFSTEAIIAKRREKAVEEDKLRPAALVRQKEIMDRIKARMEQEAKGPFLTPEMIQGMIDGAVAKALAAKQ